MKRLLAVLALCLLSSTVTFPQSGAVPAKSRKVFVTLKTGDAVTGTFVRADRDELKVEVGGNPVTIKMDEVVSINFAGGEVPSGARENSAASLSVDAGLVYRTGGVQPVARTNFVLLDKSLEEILKEAGFPNEKGMGVLSTYAFAVKYPSQYAGLAERAHAAFQPHVVQSFTTDFGGKAQLTGVKPGRYYVAGVAETRRGFAVWNVPVEIKPGQNSLTLDQNNAAAAL